MARYLKKRGDSYLYNWTEALAARSDMYEVGPEKPKKAAKPEPAPAETEAVDELDELDTVAALREYAEREGIEIPTGTRAKEAIREAIREARDAEPAADDNDDEAAGAGEEPDGDPLAED